MEDFIKKINQWKSYINEIVPKRMEEIKKNVGNSMSEEELKEEGKFANEEYDVIVVGFGAAG